MAEKHKCQRCGATIIGDSPGEHCLSCLISFGLKGSMGPEPLENDGTASADLEFLGDFGSNYRVLDKLGEGGCGVVYHAVQLRPVRREVALKVIKLGMDTPAVVARFDAERQALAMMEHPGIARVFDAGVTSAGRPFFVMELVSGVPITEYAERRRLPIPQRLRLFIELCHAVQHAHQKGVIHRDIKPSNVLVVESNGEPGPKVIDFGVAKATARQRLSDQTLYTAFDQFVGTPAYMSPEQASLTGEEVDTRTDIYSLGVLLYELLIGVPPFDPQRLRSAALDEICRIVRYEEPIKPSSRIGTRRSPSNDGTNGKSSASDQSQKLDSDLDWIVMKALEKQRSRRYETAAEFALDVERQLRREPVSARPPSAAYRFARAVQRNRGAFAAGTVVLIAMIAGLATATWGFIKEREARDLAGASEKRAAQQAVRSEQVAAFLKEMLASVGPSVARGRDTTLLRDVLDNAATRVSSELTAHPAVQAELHATIGRVYSDLAMLENAESMHRAALRLRESIFPHGHPACAESLLDLVRVLNHRATPSDLAEAEPLARRALETYRRALDPKDSRIPVAIEFLAWNLRAQRRHADAEALFREALEYRRKLVGNQHLDTTASMNALAMILETDPKRRDEAEALARASLAIMRRTLGNEHPELTSPLGVLGSILRERGKTSPAVAAEAEHYIREFIALEKRHRGPENANLPDKLNLLAANLCDQRKYSEAEMAVLEAIAIEVKVQGSNDTRRAARWFLSTLTKIYFDQQKWPEAERTLLDWQGLCSRMGCDRGIEMDALYWQSNILMAQERWLEGESVLVKRLKLCEEMEAEAVGSMGSLHIRRFLGEALRRNRKFAEAESILKPAFDKLQAFPDRANRIEAWNCADQLTQLYEALGRPGDVAVWKQRRSELVVPQ